MNNEKTIKQIADELGVSKTAVRKKIANLGLHSSLQKTGNQFLVSEHDESIIKSAFLKNKSQTKNANKVSDNREQSETILQLVSILQDELNIKNQQLNIKDKQIEELNARLAEAYQIIDHGQKLHGADKVLKIAETKEKISQIDNEQIISKNPEKRKKTWYSIFKK